MHTHTHTQYTSVFLQTINIWAYTEGIQRHENAPRTRKMAQSVKCLPGKQGNLSSGPQNSGKAGCHMPIFQGLGRQRQEDPWDSMANQHSKQVRNTITQNRVESNWRRHWTSISLCPPHAHTCTHKPCTHTHQIEKERDWHTMRPLKKTLLWNIIETIKLSFFKKKIPLK